MLHEGWGVFQGGACRVTGLELMQGKRWSDRGLTAVGRAVRGFSASTSTLPGGGRGGDHGWGGRQWLDLGIALLYRWHVLLLLGPRHELRVDHEVVDGAVGLEARVQWAAESIHHLNLRLQRNKRRENEEGLERLHYRGLCVCWDIG